MMLMVLVNIGSGRYALSCDHVIEIVPRVALKAIAHAPDFVLGMLNFRGVPVPVVDTCQLLENRPSSDRLHTRIIITEFPREDGGTYILGFVAEMVTETRQIDPSKFIDAGVRVKQVPYLGGVWTREKDVVQQFLLDPLFEQLRDDLFSPQAPEM